ncbi:MAG TPA: hypothetical protein VGI39_16825 [Polyangiaceae bacterium]|jgi:hypothetical protein
MGGRTRRRAGRGSDPPFQILDVESDGSAGRPTVPRTSERPFEDLDGCQRRIATCSRRGDRPERSTHPAPRPGLLRPPQPLALFRKFHASKDDDLAPFPRTTRGENVSLPGSAFFELTKAIEHFATDYTIDTGWIDDAQFYEALDRTMSDYGVNWCDRCSVFALYTIANANDDPSAQDLLAQCGLFGKDPFLSANSLPSGSPPDFDLRIDLSTGLVLAGGRQRSQLLARGATSLSAGVTDNPCGGTSNLSYKAQDYTTVQDLTGTPTFELECEYKPEITVTSASSLPSNTIRIGTQVQKGETFSFDAIVPAPPPK